jgi:hypothetical protein
MSDRSVSVIEFINSNNLYANTIYYYVNTNCGKKYLPEGQHNELNTRTIEEVIENNKQYHPKPKGKFKFPIIEAQSIFTKHTADLFVIDVDEKCGINTMEDFIEKFKIDIFKDCPWVKGNVKGIHIYVFIKNVPVGIKEFEVFKDFKGDLLGRTNNTWENVTKRFSSTHIPTFEFADIKHLFNHKIVPIVKEKKAKKEKLRLVEVEEEKREDDTDLSLIEKEMTAYIKHGVANKIFEKMTGRDTWINIGFIIKNTMGDKGRHLFVDLSRHDEKFNQDEVCKIYDDLTIDDREKKIGLPSLINYYNEVDENLTKLIVKKVKKELKKIQKQNDDEDEHGDDYENMKAEFEKQHAKIVENSLFVKKNIENNRFITFKKEGLMTSYEHMNYKKYVLVGDEVKEIKTSFIHTWLKDENILKYNTMDVYPPPLICPSNVYNLWTPFAMELVKDFNDKPDVIDTIKRHLLILCGNDQPVADYLLNWMAQMVQFPAVKTTMPVFVSDEGAGKGTLVYLLRKLLGDGKMLKTSSCDNVFGFNGLMASSFLVNLDELEPKELKIVEGKMKEGITEATLVINGKGQPQYTINSFHRYIMTTNKEELVLIYMPTSKDDRRKFIIRCSDELIADPEKPDYEDKKKYFENFYAMLDDVNSVKTFYEYLKSIPNMKDFNKLKLPKTEFHQQIKENIKDEYDMDSWVKTLLANEENTNDCYFLPNRTKAKDLFNHYVNTTGNKKKINEREFICKFAKMKLNGYDNDLKLGKKSKPNIGLDRDLMMEHLDMLD